MKIREFAEKFDGFVKCNSSDSLQAALGKAKGSHRPVFVYNSDIYVGVFWPYWALFKTRPNADAKLSEFLGPVPHYFSYTSIFQVIDQMLSLRLYVIPFFDDKGEIEGVVTAKGIIKKIFEDKKLRPDFLRNIKIRKVSTVKTTDSIRKIYSRMRKEAMSRVVAVDDEGRTRAILSRQDIYMALIWPTDKSRMRTQSGKTKQLLFDKEWPEKLDFKIKEVMTTEVNLIEESEGKEEAIRQLIKSGYGSILITDDLKKPVGLISKRSCLKAFLALREERMFPVLITDRKKLLDFFRLEEIERILAQYGRKVAKIEPLSRLRVVIDAVKNPAGKATSFDLTLKNVFRGGKDVIVKTQTYEIRDGLNELIRKSRKKMGLE